MCSTAKTSEQKFPASLTSPGGVGTVTVGCRLLEVGGPPVLLDRGLFQGVKERCERELIDQRKGLVSIRNERRRLVHVSPVVLKRGRRIGWHAALR